MKTLRRLGAIGATASLLAVAAGQATAYPRYLSIGWTERSGCIASLNGISDKEAGSYKVQGVTSKVQSAASNIRCVGWLTRSTDGGRTWKQISGLHTVTTAPTLDTTGWYWNGPGYRAKNCVDIYKGTAYYGHFCSGEWRN
ncbi:hypothetical protein KNE206_53570 [Kitasatospora sp. NE20-6]|uniref:hypothetical protein n=1 Tax=Kitasatospora sp. NE20-6 TaxID=2859066 RepID=UPI0034DC9C9C